MSNEKELLSKPDALKALRVVADFQADCADKARFAITYPVVRNPNGQNLKQVLAAAGFPDFRLVTDSLEHYGFVKTHGWRNKAGVRGFVLQITPAGREALAKPETKAKSGSAAKSASLEDILATLLRMINR